MKPIVFIVSAPSGSGKSTLVNGLFERLPGLRFSISYTTRLPRGAESNGESYYFTGRAEFEAMIENGEFLEYARPLVGPLPVAARLSDHPVLKKL